MTDTFEDLCAGCEIGTDCCKHLTELRASPAEYERHFANHRDGVVVRPYGDAYLVSAPNNCPHLRGTQCSVYETRPVDCHLFPHSVGGMKRIGNLVIVTYHHRTHCPRKARLLASRERVVELLTRLSRDIYGNHVRVLVVPDVLPVRLARVISRVPRKVRKLLTAGASV